jgi:hypothetical protein
MAKKMKLEPTLVESVQKVLDIQDLLITPEAKKLQALDQDMQKILENKNLSLTEKIQKFELTLGEFRQVQDKIIEQGTTSLADRLRNDSWKEEMRELMQSMLDETVNRHLQNQSSTLQGTAASSSNLGIESTVEPHDDSPAAMSTPTLTHPDTPHQLPESPPSAILASASETPTTVRQPPVSGSTAETSTALWEEIEKVLKSGGMKVHGSRYLFPILDSPTRIRLKRQHQDYAASTFQKVLTILTSNKVQSMPLNAAGIVDCVKKILRPARSQFAAYFDVYPNLEKLLDGQRVLNFNKWTSFHDSPSAENRKRQRNK